jgi:hypothetical protein
MAKDSSAESENQSTELPAPEVLAPRSDEASKGPEAAGFSGNAGNTPKSPRRLRRGTYRPSHKATFIGLAVVVGVLLVNAVIITLILRGQSSHKSQANQDEVTISGDVLEKLGVNRTPVGDLGLQLVVGPAAKFNNKVQVSGDVNISGQLKLNNKITATDASLTKLDAGNTSLGQLNVNGDGTLSSLNLRKDLVVTGTTRLQGTVTVSQLFTVNNNVNVSGNLAVGGTLSVGALHISSGTIDSNLTIGGHIITRGSAPSVSRGSATGSNGSVSISGNDASGTVAVNAGTGAGNGMVATVTFRNRYNITPHVVVTPIGNVGVFYISRSSTGFSIYVGNGLSPGGYAFDYIVHE